jgi:competence protein ComEA
VKLPVHFSVPYSLLAAIAAAAAIAVAFLPRGSVHFQWAAADTVRNVNIQGPSLAEIVLSRAIDPNTASQVQLDSLLLPSYVSRNWLRYIEKGGRFRTKEDLRKIYGLNDSIFKKIEAFIYVPALKSRGAQTKKTGRYERQRESRPQRREKIKVCLNTAPADSLRLRGIIGEKRSAAIVSLRQRLGGFYELEQLSRQGVVPDSLLPALSGFYFIDTLHISKRSLRSTTEREFAAHPLAGPFAGKHIAQAMQISAEVESIKDLLLLGIIDSAKYSQMRYYWY